MRSIWSISEIKRKLHEHRARSQSETPEQRAARLTATATIWIAVFTVILAIVGGITLYEVIAGGEDTSKLAQAAVNQAAALKNLVNTESVQSQAALEAADAAKTQAGAAIRALQRNLEFFHLDEQAQIRIVSVESGWEHGVPVNPTLTANYRYANVGKTAADLIGVDKHVDLIDARSDVDALTFPETSPKPSLSIPRIFTGDQPLISAFNSSISRDKDGDAVAKGSKFIVSWGCFKYRDAFGGVHWTDFCHVRQPAPNEAAYATCAYKCKREAN